MDGGRGHEATLFFLVEAEDAGVGCRMAAGGDDIEGVIRPVSEGAEGGLGVDLGEVGFSAYCLRESGSGAAGVGLFWG